MTGFQQRIAELWRIQKQRKLTNDEMSEMCLCLDANEGYAHKLAKLEELSYQAHQTNDWDWLHEICAEIEKLNAQYSIKSLPNNPKQV